MDDPWADTPSSSTVVIPPRPPKADRRSIPQPKATEPEAEPKVVEEAEPEEEEVKADETHLEGDTTTSILEEAGVASSTNGHEDETVAVAGDDDGDDGFDDFDDFDTPAGGPSTFAAPGEGDGFGDFGDFEEGDFDQPAQIIDGADEGVNEVLQVEVPIKKWSALNLRPFPNRSELLDQLSEIMSPLVPPPEMLGDAPVRSVGGLGQVMHAESSRDAYAQLTTAPILKPLDWTRSRVRREHLISMGVPVNLDEVDSHRISALPPLRITTVEGRRAASLDVRNSNKERSSSRDKGKGREEGPRSAVENGSGKLNGNGDGSGSGSGKYGLGNKPELDVEKAEELCGLEEYRLSLLPLATLRKIQDELVKTSAQASASLAWGLQFKDAQSQDSATYNGMISELISNAAKAKSAQQTGSGGVFRRSSQKVPVRSGSGTPRVGSPANR